MVTGLNIIMENNEIRKRMIMERIVITGKNIWMETNITMEKNILTAKI